MNEEEEGGGMNEEDTGTAQRRHRLDRATPASLDMMTTRRRVGHGWELEMVGQGVGS